MFGPVPALEQRVAEFLKDAVGEPTAGPVYGDVEEDVYHANGSSPASSPQSLRQYSSAQEAELRGLRRAAANERDDKSVKTRRN
jgi:hypothetical protein